jgi:SET domain-containing protein
MFQTADLEVRHLPGKGRGVFARRAFAPGEVIEYAPVIMVIPAEQVPLIEVTPIMPYYYYWGADLTSAAIAGGFGSFYNHDPRPNARMIRDQPNERIVVEALAPIAAGDEITFNYRAARDDEPLEFDPV